MIFRMNNFKELKKILKNYVTSLSFLFNENAIFLY